MSEIQQLLSQLPVQQIAQQAGVGEDEARQALEAIVPTLVGGMQANAHDPGGAQSLMGALGAHAGHFDERVAGNVDTADGEKIVHNIFGDNTDQIARAAGGGGALGGIIMKILPIVAPMVLAWIANKLFKQGGGQAAPSDADRSQAPTPTSGDSPFGQGSAGAEQKIEIPQGQAQAPQGQAQRQSDGFGLDDLLGGILGGGQTQGGQTQGGQTQGGQSQGQSQGGPLGPLGDLLGGLLGGGRRS